MIPKTTGESKCKKIFPGLYDVFFDSKFGGERSAPFITKAFSTRQNRNIQIVHYFVVSSRMKRKGNEVYLFSI